VAALQTFERPVLIGSAEPRLWTRPLRELTPETSLGFEAIDFADRVLGIDLLPWQKWLFIHGLELKPDGSYRFRTVLVLVARQNGKTTALKVLALWRLIMDGARLVLGTSTNLDYARESWEGCVELAKGSDLHAEFQWPERRTNGEQTLTANNGARYKIGTASRRGGRSLSVDLLILDEIREHRTWDAWSASSKTTNARPRGQRWALSNMGDDGSVVLNHLQEKALAGADSSLGIFEWSAPAGCDTSDRLLWPLANPALGYTISEEALASDYGTDTEEVFRTEVLCQRVPTLEPLPITLDMWWDAARNRKKLSRSSPVFGVSVSPSQRSASIVVAVMASKNVAHIELVDHRGGVDWIVRKMQQLSDRYGDAEFVMVQTGAMASLLPDLIKAEIEPIQLNTTDLGRAYGHMQRRLQDRQLTHSGAQAFEDALMGAVKRDVGEGLWSLGWRKATSDLTPLEAGAIALWERAGEEDPDPNIAGFY
jgi:phage terminase large subunit-like protein